MFSGDKEGETKAKAIADWFADYESFQSHGRRVSPDEAIAKGLKVTWLENDHQLQDLILSVHHAASHTITGTTTTKIIENHHGRAWIKMAGVIVQAPLPAPGQTPTPSKVIGSPSNAPMNRAERRRLERQGK